MWVPEVPYFGADLVDGLSRVRAQYRGLAAQGAGVERKCERSPQLSSVGCSGVVMGVWWCVPRFRGDPVGGR